MPTQPPESSSLCSAKVWTPRAWLACAPGEVPTMLWIAFLHLSAIVGLILLPLPPLSAMIVMLAALFIGGLGTTIVYHRALAHRAVTVNPVIEQFFIFFAMFNGSGSPCNWVGNHRHHHTHSDRPGDISSPHHGGFWWSHLRWLWQADQRAARRHVRDLASTQYTMWSMLQPLVLALALGLGALWFIEVPWRDALAAMLWLGPIRLLWALLVQCSVNSVCHLGPQDGGEGSSINVGWLLFAHLGQGENWHGNHHSRPSSERIGNGWQLDIGWLTIRALRLFGLASVPKRSSKAALQPAAMAESAV